MYQLEKIINTIICGDTLTVLKNIPDESINCVVTSPPYWGLRDYGIEPIIWDGDKDCKHEWGDKTIKPLNLQAGNPEFKRNWRKLASNDKSSRGQFCFKCGAWRGSLGLEPTFELYIKHLCDIFDEIKRVLREDGTCFVNIGDTYWGGGNNKGSSPDNLSVKQFSNRGARGQVQQKWTKDYPSKSLCLIPQRFAIEMVNRGWILRNVIIWHKPNCMPSSVKDRFTVDFEPIYFFVKNRKYWFEQQFEELNYDSFRETKRGKNSPKAKIGDLMAASVKARKSLDNWIINPQGRNKRCVWTISTQSFSGAHFATFPIKLIEPMIQAGCPKNGICLDPFMGSGTTALVALKQGKRFIGIELKQEYIDMAYQRISKVQSNLF